MHGFIELQIICIACSFWRKRAIWWLSYILPIIYSFLYLRVRSLQFSNEKPDIGNVSNTVMCWPNAICNTVQYCPLLSNTVQYCPILSTTVQYCPILSNTVQYCPILSNTVQYWPNVICTDDAQTILWVSICRHNWTQSCRTQLNNTTQSRTTHNPIRSAQFNPLLPHKRTMRNDWVKLCAGCPSVCCPMSSV